MKSVNGCTPYDNYTDWARYFKNKFYKDNSDVYNILHYLKGMLSMYQKREDFFKTAVIPIYTVFLTIILTIFTTIQLNYKDLTSSLEPETIFYPFIFVVAIFLSFVIICCYHFYDNCRNKIIFYENCIRVIKNAKAGHQKNGD